MNAIDPKTLIRRRNIVGGVGLEDSFSSDNLAIALGCYFSHHMSRPDEDAATENEDNHHLGEWVLSKVNAALDMIAAEIYADPEEFEITPRQRLNVSDQTPRTHDYE